MITNFKTFENTFFDDEIIAFKEYLKTIVNNTLGDGYGDYVDCQMNLNSMLFKLDTYNNTFNIIFEYIEDEIKINISYVSNRLNNEIVKIKDFLNEISIRVINKDTFIVNKNDFLKNFNNIDKITKRNIDTKKYNL